MEKANGSNAPKNADTVSELSWKTARRNTMTANTKRTTGEPCNAKVLSTVRWGTMGKGPDNWYLACSLPNYQQGTLCGYEVREYCAMRKSLILSEEPQNSSRLVSKPVTNFCVR